LPRFPPRFHISRSSLISHRLQYLSSSRRTTETHNSLDPFWCGPLFLCSFRPRHIYGLSSLVVNVHLIRFKTRLARTPSLSPHPPPCVLFFPAWRPVGFLLKHLFLTPMNIFFLTSSGLPLPRRLFPLSSSFTIKTCPESCPSRVPSGSSPSCFLTTVVSPAIREVSSACSLGFRPLRTDWVRF